jgi:ribosomal-protein-alanine N-acetyltransferase
MIRGEKIILRTIRSADLDELFELKSDIKDRGEFFPITLSSEPLFKKEFSETGFWEEETGHLLITDKENRILGYVAFFKSSTWRNTYEIGFVIFKPEDWGKGYMTEAVSLFVPYPFELKDVNRIEATTVSGNTGSQKVLEKCGFKHEGVLRQTVFYRGEVRDVNIFSILRDESGPLTLR